MFLCDIAQFNKRQEDRDVKTHTRRNKNGMVSVVKKHSRNFLIGGGVLGGLGAGAILLKNKNARNKLAREVGNRVETTAQKTAPNVPTPKIQTDDEILQQLNPYMHELNKPSGIKGRLDKLEQNVDKKWSKDVFGDDKAIFTLMTYQESGYENLQFRDANARIGGLGNAYGEITKLTTDKKDFEGLLPDFLPNEQTMTIGEDIENNKYFVRFTGIQHKEVADISYDDYFKLRKQVYAQPFLILDRTENNKKMLNNMVYDYREHIAGKPSFYDSDLRNLEVVTFPDVNNRKQTGARVAYKTTLDDKAMKSYFTNIRSANYDNVLPKKTDKKEQVRLLTHLRK